MRIVHSLFSHLAHPVPGNLDVAKASSVLRVLGGSFGRPSATALVHTFDGLLVIVVLAGIALYMLRARDNPAQNCA